MKKLLLQIKIENINDNYIIHVRKGSNDISFVTKKSINVIKDQFSNSKAIPIKTETVNVVTDKIEPFQTTEAKGITYPNGTVYTGDLINNKKEGKGRLIFPIGGYYSGDFHNDNYEGYGTLCTENTIYHGNFSKGEKEGEGRSENIKEGTSFVGNWKYNQKNGFGKEIFPDGSYYQGNFINGVKSGYGILYLANGNEYRGEFVDDCIEGKGSFFWNEKRKYIGNWKNNTLNGFGIMIQEKDKHIGYYKNDQKSGIGFTYFFKTKSYIFGNWIEDKLQGLAVYYMPRKDILLWKMQNNQLIYYYNTSEEIKIIKTSQEYINFKEFCQYLINNHLIDDLMIEEAFLL